MSVLIINLNFSDLSPEASDAAASFCSSSDRVLVLDLAHYDPFLVHGKPVERRVWKDSRESALAEARVQAKRLAEDFEGALSDTRRFFGRSFSYQEVPLWDVLKTDFLSAFFKRRAAYEFFAKIFASEGIKKILFTSGASPQDPDLVSWLEPLGELVNARGLELIEIPSSGQTSLKKGAGPSGLFEPGRTRFSALVRRVKVAVIHFIEGLGREKVIAFGLRFFGSVQAMAPFFERLKKHRFVHLWVLDTSERRAEGLLESAGRIGISHGIFRKKFSRKTKRAVSAALPDLMKEVEALKGHQVFKRRFSDEQMRTVFEPVLEEHFSPGAIEKTLFRIESIKQLLDRGKMKRIVLEGGQTAEQKICCFLAERRKIKTVLVPYYTDQFSLETHAYSLSRPFFGDHYLVMGEKVKKTLVDCGLEAGRVKITGTPKFNITRKDASPKPTAAFFEKWKIPGTFTGVFVWTLQGFWEERILCGYFEEVMRFFPEKLLILRPHPMSSQKIHMKPMPNVRVHTDAELGELLAVSELVITSTSVTAFDAILRDKPVLVLNLWHRPYPFPFIHEKAAVEVTRKADIIPAIEKVLKDSETRDALHRGRQEIKNQYHPGAEIDAVERIVRAITE